MTFPIQITFRGMTPSASLEESVQQKANDLGKYCDKITSCRVTLEAPSNHHRNGQHYHVTIDLNVPGQEIVANRAPAQHTNNEDVHLAIRDAFRAARSELKRYIERQRD